ncbi:MAG: SMP-30/gluconolactonase/LRE family protein [Bacteroidota bacterium]
MIPKRPWVAATLLLLLLMAGYVAVGILVPAGVFKSITPHFSGIEKSLALPLAGAEDITISQTGIVFVSADDRRQHRANPGSHTGALLVMNLHDTVPTFVNVTPPGLSDFHPHGISLWQGDSVTILFVINHQKQYSRHTVERFAWRNGVLSHLETFYDSMLMTSPNDLVAVGERSFYVTNDHGYAQLGIGRTLEDYLQRALSYVNYFDGTAFRKVAEGIAYANGINQSQDGLYIFVTSTTGRKLLVYNRNPDTGELSLIRKVNVKTGADNIEVDAHGALWIGCHPQLLKFAKHASDSTKKSPSQVIKVTDPTGYTYAVEEIYLNDGTTLSGSSVAAVYGQHLLIGSVFENKILHCTIKT